MERIQAPTRLCLFIFHEITLLIIDLYLLEIKTEQLYPKLTYNLYLLKKKTLHIVKNASITRDSIHFAINSGETKTRKFCTLIGILKHIFIGVTIKFLPGFFDIYVDTWETFANILPLVSFLSSTSLLLPLDLHFLILLVFVLFYSFP